MKMASYEHTGRSPILITLKGCMKGLGVSIAGGREAHCGIFIKAVLANSLAARDGQLREGDQLLEANGQSLVNVSKDRAVEILKHCTATDSVKLLLSRDATAQSGYRRLLDILADADANSTLPANTPKAPVTSTPYHVDDKPLPTEPKLLSKQNMVSTPSNGVSDSVTSPPWGSPLQSPNFESSSAVLQWQKHSTSASKPPVMYPSPSDEQGASSSDSGSHDEMTGHTNQKPSATEQATPTLYDGSQVALSDVVLSETKCTPLLKPISLSPLNERGVDINDSLHASSRHGVVQPLGDVITIPKDKGLGITLTGGIGRPDGPGIYIAAILDGFDAHNNKCLRVGDQLLKVNEESFENLQLEKAKHLLTQMKTRQQVSNYIIQIRRKPCNAQAISAAEKINTPVALSSNQGGMRANKSPSHNSISLQSSTNPNTSVFDSSTLIVTNNKPGKIIDEADIKGTYQHSPILRKKTRQAGFGNSERTSAYDSMRQRLSVDAGARFKLTKLEYALNYMGFVVTPEKQERFRTLDIDAQGKVILADFTALCKEMFRFESGDGNLNFENQLTLALTQKDSLDFPISNAVASGEIQSLEELLKENSKAGRIPTVDDENDISSMMSTPVKYQGDLSPREVELQTKLALTEKALRASKKKERDMKNMLQARTLQEGGGRENQSSAELQKRLAVMDCEWKKEQATARRYQVATEKLLLFAEECHDILVNSPDASRTLYYVQGSGQSTLRGDQVTGNPRPPRYLSKHARETAVTLAQKAKEISLSVHEILKTEELPFGWGKCINEAGVLYYINHQTQTTSWANPLTHMKSIADTQSHDSSMMDIGLP